MTTLIATTLFGVGLLVLIGIAVYRMKVKYPNENIGDIFLLHVREETTSYLLLLIAVASIAEGMVAASIDNGGIESNVVARMISHVALIVGAFIGAITVSQNVNNILVHRDSKGTAFAWSVLALISFFLTIFCPYMNVAALANGMGASKEFELYVMSLKFWVGSEQYATELIMSNKDPRTYSAFGALPQILAVAIAVLIMHYLVLMYDMIYAIYLSPSEAEKDKKKEEKEKDKDKEKEKPEKEESDVFKALGKILGLSNDHVNKLAKDCAATLVLQKDKEPGKETELIAEATRLRVLHEKADTKERGKIIGEIRAFLQKGTAKNGMGVNIPKN
jgi:hypothetical protein